jgi:ammonium transporter, Amt family
VTPTSIPPELPATTAALCTVFIFLIPFAGAGLALINTGLGRSRSAAHCMMSALCAISVAALVYFVCGFAWQGFAGQPAYLITVGGSTWDWIAAGPFLFRHMPLDGSPASLAALLGMFSVGLAALIPTGSGCDRWRLGACCASTALLAGWTFPLFAHWVWGGGWLAELGVKYGMGHGFVDAGGSGTIQVTGGLTALAIAWIIGPRRGKYAADGMPSAIPGHNVVLVVFGCALALAGWLGLNSAGAILFYGVDPGRVVGVAVNTMIAATSAAVASALITNVRFGKPDTSLSANGWIGGLAASSAAAPFIVPAEAAIIGLAAGILVTLSVEWFELRMSVDDPGGAISAHAVGGLWGLLAAGLFATLPEQAPGALGESAMHGQWLAQVMGIATLIGFVFPLTYGLNLLLNRFYPQRVAPEGERQGMDLYELGAGAYPEFLTHSEEFTQRRLE